MQTASTSACSTRMPASHRNSRACWTRASSCCLRTTWATPRCWPNASRRRGIFRRHARNKRFGIVPLLLAGDHDLCYGRLRIHRLVLRTRVAAAFAGAAPEHRRPLLCGHLGNVQEIADDPRYSFVRADIRNASSLNELFLRHKPRAVVHFAAESHVDRSITAPADFLDTNVNGTVTLLRAAQALTETLPRDDARAFRFPNVSTDEVFGSLEAHDAPFSEHNAYRPNSPYSASKAAADHFV